MLEQELPPMPAIVKDIVRTFKKKHKKANTKMILAMALSNISFMITSKRVKYKESGKKGFPNMYVIIFAPSGCGKDSISNDLRNYLFTGFEKWFKTEAETYRNNQIQKINEKADKNFPEGKQIKQKQAYIREQTAKIRNLVLEMDSGTAEGFYEEAKARFIAEAGAIYIKMTEFAKYYANSSPSDKQFFDMLFKAFDGIIQSKSIKGNNRDENIIGVPVNCLLMTDISMFDDTFIRKNFNKELNTGFARRAFIIYVKRKSYEINDDIDVILKEENEFYKETKILSKNINDIFTSIEKNTIYKMPYETLSERTRYSNKLTKLANNTEDDILAKEIADRELKAVKLATIFAVLNKRDKTVTVEDFKQAEGVIEYLSGDFKEFIKYKPKYNDKYDELYNFFLENINQTFAKTKLINMSNNFGFTKREFRKEFDDVISLVAGKADEKGYNLLSRPFNHNSGMEYWLTKKIEDNELKHSSLSEIISESVKSDKSK